MTYLIFCGIISRIYKRLFLSGYHKMAKKLFNMFKRCIFIDIHYEILDEFFMKNYYLEFIGEEYIFKLLNEAYEKNDNNTIIYLNNYINNQNF